jgi:hypothetical protein
MWLIQTPKQVDIKSLKNSIWKTISSDTHQESENSDPNSKQSENDPNIDPTTFQVSFIFIFF